MDVFQNHYETHHITPFVTPYIYIISINIILILSTYFFDCYGRKCECLWALRRSFRILESLLAHDFSVSFSITDRFLLRAAFL
jgi:hypothetical protein